ncbi:L-lactate dehydrogenase [Culicoidibacter larvae]|uniref:L-lactate dehydrogenase n=1 Tax=Culicoidibacter larvae TaxID=2579976 RepID=A0A5R8QER5_9FIRM|nr:L-lactate dehydrogenase [Culicoidibacter larvae]TLG76519.1 L-lactate dehydrogenase [Culicoidibacter larvae]
MFTKNVRRVALIGTGFVGMSFAYSLMNQGGADELVLIDLDVRKTEGEAMDLNHGVAFAPSNMKVWAGTYADCQYADIVVITAGAAQAPGETRLDLTAKNTKIMKSIVEQIMANGFNGIMVVASNPVDILSYVAWKASGLDKSRVIGTGTSLDTARLRYMIGQYIDIDSRNIHAYMMAEHGDSSFVPWTNVYVGSKPLLQMIDESEQLHMEDLQGIYESVRDAAYEIIERKKATYYGIGMALTRIVKAIFNDENSILTLSTYLDGEYGHSDVYIGVPAVINRLGIREIITLDLNEVDQAKFDKSANTLKETMNDAVHPYL